MVSHFITFAFVGFYFPDTFIFQSFGFCIDDKQKLKGQSQGASWWYGQYEDVIADAIGFIFGKYLSQRIKLKGFSSFHW